LVLISDCFPKGTIDDFWPRLPLSRANFTDYEQLGSARIC